MYLRVKYLKFITKIQKEIEYQIMVEKIRLVEENTEKPLKIKGNLHRQGIDSD